MKHPAKYSDALMPIFAEILSNSKVILDPMAGTGKITKIRDYGWEGIIYCNDILDWKDAKVKSGVNKWTFYDAALLIFPKWTFDAICTSPTYGNRMADHFYAKDTSKRITYRHCYGERLSPENTGRLQWGESYRKRHNRIYIECIRVLKPNGLFILNVSNHIRKGGEVKVSDWHKQELQHLGLELLKSIEVPTPRMKFGANYELRPKVEYIFVFTKAKRSK